MKPTTFLSLPLKPWSLSVGFHLVLFFTLTFMGRSHILDLALIELDLAPASKMQAAPSPPLDDEWQKPQVFRRHLPPPPKPLPKPEAAPAPGPVVQADQGMGSYRSVAQVSQLPRYVNQVKPQYPEAAKRASIEGVVILQVDIDATGTLKKVELVQGLGYGCDEAAIAAVQQSTFTPAYQGSEPVAIKGLKLPYRFKFDY